MQTYETRDVLQKKKKLTPFHLIFFLLSLLLTKYMKTVNHMEALFSLSSGTAVKPDQRSISSTVMMLCQKASGSYDCQADAF